MPPYHKQNVKSKPIPVQENAVKQLEPQDRASQDPAAQADPDLFPPQPPTEAQIEPEHGEQLDSLLLST